MSKKDRICCILLTIVLSVFSLIPLFGFKAYAKESIESLYKVYLHGESIGVIKSKEKLEKYINEEQKELKEKYVVDNVYLPKGLYISEYTTYNTSEIVSEESIYNLIKETENFTIKGYTVSIEKEVDEEDTETPTDEPTSTKIETITLNILNEKDFDNAITSVVKAFVSDKDLEAFLNNKQAEIVNVGKKIEDLFINENITIKETYIPSDEKIFLDEKEITKYLLFGDNASEEIYTVKAGDTIESIADSNKLAVEELLVVNQDLKSKNNLLSIGQKVSVSLISPIVTVVVEEHVVEETTIAYTTEIQYDSTKAAGTSTIKQEGKDGKQIVTQKLKYENGEIVTALIADTKVVDEVINQIKVVGTMSTATIDPNDIAELGDWYWPTLTPYIISSPYGWRWGILHDGTDITGTGYGSPIFAANNGVVYKVAWNAWPDGNEVIIAHANDYYTIYAHLATIGVSVGDTITRGQKIGTMGSTGYSTGTHLHFGAFKGIPYRGGTSFNAMTLFR